MITRYIGCGKTTLIRHLLSRPELEQFAQPVSPDFHIEPLAADEVGDYIRHRLRVAGADEPLFDDAAVQRIWGAAGGIPRKINILCDTALVYGFSQQAPSIGVDIVEEVLRDKAQFGVWGSRNEGGEAAQGASGRRIHAVESRPVDDEAERRRDEQAAREVLAQGLGLTGRAPLVFSKRHVHPVLSN